jgi:hypothetical protein
MEPAHFLLPYLDWPESAPPTRRAARLYLPGNECLARGSGGGGSTATTVAGADPAAPPVAAPVYQAVDPGTTIPPEILDPEAPLPSVASGLLVYNCARGLPRPPAPTTTAPATATTTAPAAEAPPASGG